MSTDEPPFICAECGHPTTAHQAAVTHSSGPCSVCGCRAIRGDDPYDPYEPSGDSGLRD